MPPSRRSSRPLVACLVASAIREGGGGVGGGGGARSAHAACPKISQETGRARFRRPVATYGTYASLLSHADAGWPSVWNSFWVAVAWGRTFSSSSRLRFV